MNDLCLECYRENPSFETNPLTLTPHVLLFRRVQKHIPEPEIKSTGYVIDTLEASLWSLFNHDNFEETLLCAVNLGHDADTVGAVTGAMAGIVYGSESIPPEWIDRLARKEDIIGLAYRMAIR